MDVSQVSSLTYLEQLFRCQSYSRATDIEDSASEATETDSSSDDYVTAADIAQKYDVRHIPVSDIAQMSQELYDNGFISLRTHSLLSFHAEMSPSYNDLKERFGAAPVQMDDPHDLLAEWKEKFDQQVGEGASSETIRSTQDVVAALSNLATMRDTLLA
jgi:hypothetical protein